MPSRTNQEAGRTVARSARVRGRRPQSSTRGRIREAHVCSSAVGVLQLPHPVLALVVTTALVVGPKVPRAICEDRTLRKVGVQAAVALLAVGVREAVTEACRPEQGPAAT